MAICSCTVVSLGLGRVAPWKSKVSPIKAMAYEACRAGIATFLRPLRAKGSTGLSASWAVGCLGVRRGVERFRKMAICSCTVVSLGLGRVAPWKSKVSPIKAMAYEACRAGIATFLRPLRAKGSTGLSTSWAVGCLGVVVLSGSERWPFAVVQ